MGILNLLSGQNIIDVAVEGIGTVELKWIGYVIKWIFDLFSGPGAIALGAIVFTLALKTLVLPLDIYSRVKMRKQSLLMGSMREDMEKLQKQYANDKNMYSQKVMELQRAHGYNPLGACLPTIVSLIIFMIVFSSFSQYSQYANLTSYNNMAIAYSCAVQEYVLTEDVKNGIYPEEDDAKNPDKYFLIAAVENGLNNPVEAPYIKRAEDGSFVDAEGKVIKIYGYYVDYNKFASYYSASEYKAEELPGDWAELDEVAKNKFVKDFVRLGARQAAADYYHAHSAETSFPAANWWIGNVWYPDSMFNKEVPSFSGFRSAISRAAGSIDANYEESYNEVTFNLQNEKNSYNGYFVLIVLAIGLMFLQQFITMRSQKAANELSTVDGQAATTNKMMMVMMPIIFGFFSFMYSAAFSIYMIVNTVYSLISTLIINKVVSVRFDNETEKQTLKKAAGRAGGKRFK